MSTAESTWVLVASVVAMIAGYATYATRGMRKTSFRFSGLGLRVVVASEDTNTAQKLDEVFRAKGGCKGDQ